MFRYLAMSMNFDGLVDELPFRAIGAVYDQTCPKYDYQNAGDAGGTQVPVAVTNGDLVCACAIPRLGQGGATAPQALSGRFDLVS